MDKCFFVISLLKKSLRNPVDMGVDEQSLNVYKWSFGDFEILMNRND